MGQGEVLVEEKKLVRKGRRMGREGKGRLGDGGQKVGRAGKKEEEGVEKFEVEDRKVFSHNDRGQ